MSRRRSAVLLIAAITAAVTLACSKKEGGGAPGPAATAPSVKTDTQPAALADTSALKKEAEEIFATRCTPCHGPAGRGDGPASAGLTPPPRNFHDASWQEQVTDQHIETIIQYGGAAVGKSPAMPPNPDLADKPVVKALRDHIRSFKQ